MAMPDAYRSRLIVRSEHPFNAEPATAQLRASFVTREPDFYVRSHGDVPRLDPATHRLRVHGLVGTPLELTMAELRASFPAHTVTATLQCAGNRRADLNRVRPVSGDPWAPGAIGTAAWTGARLGEVLQAAGADTRGALHVAFESVDLCNRKGPASCFGVSIPMHKALQPEVLLAYAMNGDALTPAHGAPVRLVVPGFAGVRSPKWLQTISVQARESDNPMQALDYKLLPPHLTEPDADPALGMTINAMPVTSAICEPASEAQLPSGLVAVRGYAMASDRAIARVDVSADGGHTWRQAALEDNPHAPWAWTFWHATLDLAPGVHELVVRAWDTAGQTQPASAAEAWNVRGYLSTAWHRVAVKVLGPARG